MKTKVEWNPYHIKEYDIAKLSDLRQSMADGSSRRSTEAAYYKWKLFENPIDDGAAVVVEKDSKVAGMASITSKSFSINSKSVKSAEIGDTFTHPKYQRLGIFSTLVNNIREYAVSDLKIKFLYGTPNEKSLPGYELKLNFHQIQSANTYNYVLPLKIKKVVKKYTDNSITSHILLTLFTLYIKTLNLFLRTKGTGYYIHETDEITEEMGSLWEYSVKDYDIINIRNEQYIKWRFINNPDLYKIYTVFNKDVLIGYFVLKEGVWNGLKVNYLADYIFIPGQRSGIIYAIKWIIEYSLINDFDLLSCWASNIRPLKNVLLLTGFLRYKKVPIICYSNEFGEKLINKSYKVYFTMADSDNI